MILALMAQYNSRYSALCPKNAASSKVNLTFTTSKDAACHDNVNNQND